MVEVENTSGIKFIVNTESVTVLSNIGGKFEVELMSGLKFAITKESYKKLNKFL